MYRFGGTFRFNLQSGRLPHVKLCYIGAVVSEKPATSVFIAETSYCSLDWQISTDVSEQDPVSIFRLEDSSTHSFCTGTDVSEEPAPSTV
jgi:hypothetical protein